MQGQTVFLPAVSFNPTATGQHSAFDPMESIREKAAYKRAMVGAEQGMWSAGCPSACAVPVNPCAAAKAACSAANPGSCVWPWVLFLIVAGVLAVLIYQSLRKRIHMKVDTHDGGFSARVKGNKGEEMDIVGTKHQSSRFSNGYGNGNGNGNGMSRHARKHSGGPIFCSRRDY